MNDYQETKIFVPLYGIKNGYEFPLPSKYKGFTIGDSGCIIINNINVSWKSQFIGESAEYTIMYNIDMGKSKYLIIVSTKDDIGTEKINKYIEKKLKKNKEFIALVVAEAASTQFSIIFSG